MNSSNALTPSGNTLSLIDLAYTEWNTQTANLLENTEQVVTFNKVNRVYSISLKTLINQFQTCINTSPQMIFQDKYYADNFLKIHYKFEQIKKVPALINSVKTLNANLIEKIKETLNLVPIVIKVNNERQETFTFYIPSNKLETLSYFNASIQRFKTKEFKVSDESELEVLKQILLYSQTKIIHWNKDELPLYLKIAHYYEQNVVKKLVEEEIIKSFDYKENETELWKLAEEEEAEFLRNALLDNLLLGRTAFNLQERTAFNSTNNVFFKPDSKTLCLKSYPTPSVELFEKVMTTYPCLENLSLGSDLKLSDLKSFISLLPKLKNLDLNSCYELDDSALQSISDLTQLENLFLNREIIGRKGALETLTTLSQLTKLAMQIPGSSDLDRDMKVIGKFTKLQSLALDTSIYSDGTLIKYISGLTNLTELTLPRSLDQYHSAMKTISAFSNLTLLDLSTAAELNDLNLKDISPLTQLRSLHLRNCVKLTDSIVTDLNKLTQLTWLDLSGCSQLTKAFFKELKLQKLDTTRVTPSDQLPSETINNLAKKYPRLNIWSMPI